MNEKIPELALAYTDVRIFVSHVNKKVYIYVPVEKISEEQASQFKDEIKFMKRTNPSCWAVRLVITSTKLGQKVTIEKQKSVIAALKGTLPRGLSLSYKELAAPAYFSSCTVIAGSYVSRKY